MITTVAQFVKAAGGRPATAEYFGVVDNAVSNWQKRGHFPGWAVPRVMSLAMTNKWAIAPDLITASKPERRRGTKPKPASRSKKHTRLHAAE